MDLYFTQYFQVDPAVLDQYGAFDVNLASDLPLFIDPFLLFNSPKPEYQALHEGIIRYLKYLRDKAQGGNLETGLINNLYRFKEVKQNWFGYTFLGNEGRALGLDFARALYDALGRVVQDFGSETITASSHLEKLCLIRPRVGKDSISDFTTNLVKSYLLEYTQEFARKNIDPTLCQAVSVTRAAFNYDTQSWETRRYYLPAKDGDYVLLTPIDMLTKDDTWISYMDMVGNFDQIPPALPDEELRAQVNNYFQSRLGEKPTQKERAEAAQKTIAQFPDLIDWYIKLKEDTGEQAQAISAQKVTQTRQVLVDQLKAVIADLETNSSFYNRSYGSYQECLDRALEFKYYVENQDGYRVINRRGHQFANENEVQLFFGLIWFKSEYDVNREPNNGRGPVDFKVSFGSGDKSLIEFKLASNSALKRNLEKQVAIYEAANRTGQSVKVIICYTEADQQKVARILRELGLEGRESIVVIDARSDNKPSASKA